MDIITQFYKKDKYYCQRCAAEQTYAETRRVDLERHLRRKQWDVH
jgi:hypothetical protein